MSQINLKIPYIYGSDNSSDENEDSSKQGQRVKGILSHKERVREFFDNEKTSVLVSIQDADVMNELAEVSNFPGKSESKN